MSEITPQSKRKQSASRQASQKNTQSLLIVLIVVAGLALVAVLILIFFFVITPTSTLTPEAPVVVDDSWERVHAAGVLKVGTSADYPPFSFYNDEYDLDGFDPALIREIGNALGLNVAISDFAFEGLGTTLQIGQVDVVIAALSVTPAREAIADFSNIYYIGQDGILALAGADIDRISAPDDFAGKRIGVQKFSVYEDWVRDNLVDTGKIPEGDLFVYAQPSHAVDDLKSGYLDLVMMDLQPATLALADGNLKLVGQGLNQQRYAIAVKAGSGELLARINQALLDLQNDGTITRLAGDYLDLKPEDIIPAPTPYPTPTPLATEGPCVDAFTFVKELNYDSKDLTIFPKLDPGEEFRKGWRIRNTGTCTWNGAYYLKYVRGSSPEAQMFGQPTSVQGKVEPGQTYDVYVDLVAPTEPGKYVGYWQVFNPEDKAFGPTIWVAIKTRLTEPDLPTETPTLTPRPTSGATATSTPRPTLGATATSTPIPTATEVPPTPTLTETPAADPLTATWILSGYRAALEDVDLTVPLEGAFIEIVFDEIDGFNGNAGCNTYSGRYVTNGVQIILDTSVLTQIFCEQPAGVMEQETLYLELLQQVEEYRFNADGQLELLRYVVDENNSRVEKVLLIFSVVKVEPFQ